MWWKPIAGTLKMCLFSHCDASPWSNVRCRTVFFLNGLRLELQTAPCEGISTGKSTWKVCSVSVSSIEMLIVTLVTKGAYLDKALAERRTTSTDGVWLHFPSPNEQTISNNRMNGNPVFLVLRMICSSRIKNLHLAGLPYWFTWRHLGTFGCSYCTAAYQRHW